MVRFNGIKINTTAGTVEIGAGITSGHVYRTLEPHKITVMAAHVSDVGVAGFTLGGGERLSSLGVPIGAELQTPCRF